VSTSCLGHLGALNSAFYNVSTMSTQRTMLQAHSNVSKHPVWAAHNVIPTAHSHGTYTLVCTLAGSFPERGGAAPPVVSTPTLARQHALTPTDYMHPSIEETTPRSGRRQVHRETAGRGLTGHNTISYTTFPRIQRGQELIN
jgi:hypothetical protein